MAEPSDELRERLLTDKWWHSDFYAGSRADLIAAGLVPEGMFPGEPGMNKYSQTHLINGIRVRVQRESRDRFRVRIFVPTEEAQRRSDAEDRRKQAQRARAEFRKNIDYLPESAADFRARMERYMESSLGTMMQLLMTFGEGYEFSTAGMEQIREAADELVAAVRNAEVIYHASKRRAYIAEMHQQAGLDDPEFATFFERVTGAAGEGARNGS